MRTALLGALLAAAFAVHASTLPPGVERVLAGHEIPRDDYSVVVQALGADDPVLTHLPDVARNPASVMKLVTTWSALELLGPAYEWPTEVYALGDIEDGRLDGDLALKGFGDPYLVVEELWKLLRALRRAGVAEIAGDLVLDDSFFDVNEAAPGAFDDRPFRSYNVVPNALLVNFKSARFEFFAEAREGRVRIAVDPPLANLEIVNRLELGVGACRGYQRGIAFHVDDARAADRIIFEGRFPAACGSYGFTRAVLRHDTYAYGLFETLWREMGGTLEGGLRRARVADDAEPLLTWQSPPLGEIIRSINKNSNNVMSRQLVYTLGAERDGAPGTFAAGERAVREFLVSRGIDVSRLVLDNGAGLSRESAATAGMLVDVLRAAARSVYAHELIASLSLGGLDGTTRGRYAKPSDDALLHVKTGRIDDVSALAGFAAAGDGRTYVIASLLNSPNADRGPGRELEQALIDWVTSLQ